MSHFKDLGSAAASSSFCLADAFSEENKKATAASVDVHVTSGALGPVDKTLISLEMIRELHPEELKPEITQDPFKSPFRIFYII